MDGNSYLDFTAQNVTVGHGNPRVTEVVKNQIMEGGLYIGDPPRIVFAEHLKKIVPEGLKDGLVGTARGGTQAVEKALLMIRAYSDRPMLFVFQGGYHGGTLGTLSITIDSARARKKLHPLVPNYVYAPYANCYRCVFGEEYPGCGLLCLENIQYVLDTVATPEDVAALFFEPIQIHGGVIVPPEEYIIGLKKICDEYNILLVDDEIITGLGRTGKLFGIDHSGITQDIMFVGKALANGLDLGAVICKKDIMEARQFQQYGNPVSCAAAIENIKIILEKRLYENSSKLGEYIMKRLEEIKEAHEIIGDIRGRGLLIGIDIVKDCRTRKPDRKKAINIILETYRNGLLMLLGGTYGKCSD